MSNIKSYLKTFFESAFTSKKGTISSWSMIAPYTNRIEVFTGESSTTLTYTAPCDGWLQIDCTQGSTGAQNWLQANLLDISYMSSNTRRTFRAPMRKGYKCETIHFPTSSKLVVLFYPLNGAV